MEKEEINFCTALENDAAFSKV